MSVPNTPVWTIPGGKVSGRGTPKVWQATGLPYASASRWGLPVPVPFSGRDFDAREPSPVCPQVSFPLIDEVLDELEGRPRTDENCLNLSVTVPTGTSSDAALPVLVWIHGGSYVTGGGDLPIYDPTALVVEQRLIVVSINYRLGLFGYLRHGDAPGNLGLLDQRAALRWVHENIAVFGGDPQHVTVFGESAGGDSVAHLMIAEGTRGLFRRAIVMSAPLGLMSRRDRMYVEMARQVQDLAPDASIDEVLAATDRLQRMSLRYGLRAGMPFGPQYGIDPLPKERDLDDAWRSAGSIDLLIGHTDREAALFVPPRLGRLPLRPAVREQLVRRLTSRIYGTPARRFAQRHSAAGGHAGRYVLRSKPANGPLAGAHTTDLPLVFPGPAWDSIVRASGPAWHATFDEGRAMRTVLAEFARSGTLDERAHAPVFVHALRS